MIIFVGRIIGASDNILVQYVDIHHYNMIRFMGASENMLILLPYNVIIFCRKI